MRNSIRKTSTASFTKNQRVAPHTNFMSLIRDLLEINRKQKQADETENVYSDIQSSTEYGTVASTSAAQRRESPAGKAARNQLSHSRDHGLLTPSAGMDLIAEESTVYDEYFTATDEAKS